MKRERQTDDVNSHSHSSNSLVSFSVFRSAVASPSIFRFSVRFPCAIVQSSVFLQWLRASDISVVRRCCSFCFALRSRKGKYIHIHIDVHTVKINLTLLLFPVALLCVCVCVFVVYVYIFIYICLGKATPKFWYVQSLTTTCCLWFYFGVYTKID